MNSLNVAKAVLARASLQDPTVPTPDVNIAQEWAQVIGDVDVADALAAVLAHYSQPNPRRIMAGDVKEGVRRIRAERIRAANSALLEPDDVRPDDVTGYLEAIRARRRAIADGRPIPPEPRLPDRREAVEQLVTDTIHALPRMPR